MRQKSVKKSRKKLNYKNVFIIVKILIILIIVFGFHYVSQTYSNTISLLAVSESDSGDIIDGSIIDLTLKITPGSGRTFVNLNTINDIDTQISVISSQKIACDIFNLDCEKYDFYYTFDSSAVILKGPSASGAIAILVAKTLNKEKLDDKVVITGSLNSGGILGNVGGINEKISIAEIEEYDRVIIPIFSDYNESIERDIEVIKAMDIIEAHNYFNGKEFFPVKKQINSEEFSILMKDLGDMMCTRAEELKEQVNFENIKVNSTLESYKVQAEKSFNSSEIAKEKGNYYSQGSFCYNANLNYKIIIEKQNNVSLSEMNKKLNELENIVSDKHAMLNSQDYKDNIKTINDFYVYLLILDRLEESRDFINEAKKLKVDVVKNETILQNGTDNNLSNIVELLDTENIEQSYDNIKSQKENLYAYAFERYYTVSLWEKFIQNSGPEIRFDNEKIDEICLKINKDISIKAQFLRNYGIMFFDEEVNKQSLLASNFGNKYLCIYKGLELSAKMNTVINSVGINNDNQKEYTDKIVNLTTERLASANSEDFPLIPYIYLEYSKDLFNQDDFNSAMLYANYALSYNDLDLYLEKGDDEKSMFNKNMTKLFQMDFVSLLFVIPLLILLAFL